MSRWNSRAAVVALAGVCLLAGSCDGTRPRPGPLDPTDDRELEVSIASPIPNTIVFAGELLTIRIDAAHTPQLFGLTGGGVVVHRQVPPERVDSQVVRFPGTNDTTLIFQVQIPAEYPTNTQLDVTAFALGFADTFRRSPVRSFIVIQCGPSVPGCN